jgi:quercetin dioxygenase-like cupin family protein
MRQAGLPASPYPRNPAVSGQLWNRFPMARSFSRLKKNQKPRYNPPACSPITGCKETLMTPQQVDHASFIASDSIGRAGSNPSAPLVNGTATALAENQVKYVPAGTGPAYQSPVDKITFLITGEQTGGAFFMAEVLVPPGGGTPPHIHHREDETFYLQQGTLTIQVGGKTLHASPGDFVCLPRGVVHCFRNTGNADAKFLLVAAPAGLEKFFEEVFYPAGDPSVEPPPMTEEFLARLLAAAPRAGLEFLPPAEQVRTDMHPL